MKVSLMDIDGREEEGGRCHHPPKCSFPGGETGTNGGIYGQIESKVASHDPSPPRVPSPTRQLNRRG